MEILHRELERDLPFVMARNAVGVLFGAVSVRVHVVPHEMSDERESIAEPHHRLVEVIAVVGVDDGVDIARDAEARHMGETGHQR